MAYLFDNIWQEVKDGNRISVYAGGEGSVGDPSQGVVVVLAWPIDQPAGPRFEGTYPTPTKAGAVRVVGATGEVLTLLAKDGSKFLFDVGSRYYLSPDTLLPLPTPQPVAQSTSGESTGGESSPAGAIAAVAVDTDTTGNTATALGPRQTCGALSTGGALVIDVTVDAVPPISGGYGGILGFQFTLLYDPAKVKVAASNASMLLAANPNSSPTPLGDATPDADGSFLVGVVDFGADPGESGQGVLARITLEGVAAGVSSLTLTDVVVTDSANSPYAIGSVLAAQVAVGAPCP